MSQLHTPLRLNGGGAGTLVLRAIDGAGEEAYRCERDFVGGSTYTVSLAHDVKGFTGPDATIEATAVVLEIETDTPGQEVIKTQLVAQEYREAAGEPSMRSELEHIHDTIAFPEGGAKIWEIVKNTDAEDIVVVHGTLGWDNADAQQGEVWVRFMTQDAGGAFHETFRYGDTEPYFDGGVHIDQVYPGFDDEADGYFPTDKAEIWFDPGATGQLVEVEMGDAFLVGMEV